MVELEAKAQGDQYVMAREYEKLTNELHEQAMTNMNLRAKVSESEFSVASLGEYLQIVRNEQKTATSSDRMLIAALREEHCDLRSRLGTSEERYEDAIRRGQDVQQRLQHVEDNARQSLPTMHEELSELRRMLKHQEDMNMKVKSEYEMYRRLPQQAAVQSSSMPTSSRATEHGWDFLSSDKVAAFPVGTEVRSPEVLTPNHRSSVSREQSRGEPSGCFAHDGLATPSWRAAIDGNRDRDARAVRDEQLKDLLDAEDGETANILFYQRGESGRRQ